MIYWNEKSVVTFSSEFKTWKATIDGVDFTISYWGGQRNTYDLHDKKAKRIDKFNTLHAAQAAAEQRYRF